MAPPVFITNEEVQSVLTWPLINESVEEALKSVVSTENKSSTTPFAHQPTRSFTPISKDNGVMLTMPGYIGNHKISVNGNENKFQTLGCKVVTSVKSNETLNPPLPSILANILLLDAQTGQLQCVMDGTLITAWRTASASIVATKYLYFSRKHVNADHGVTLAIVGCGVQGKSHALGMCTVFNVNEIRLWNRTSSRATDLRLELEANRKLVTNSNLKVKVCESVEECVLNADIVVTATYTKEPLVNLKMLKKDVHINAVGAGLAHYSELDQGIYDVASVYIDHRAGANTELKGLKTNIVCQLGDVINEGKYPIDGLTVFQSLGMAVEDVAVARAVYTHLKKI